MNDLPKLYFTMETYLFPLLEARYAGADWDGR